MDFSCSLQHQIANYLDANQQNTDPIISLQHIIGCLIIAVVGGLASLAGLGGGGPNLVILILCFDLMPKDATIVVFACILGASCGNMINQMQKAFNKEPVIKYEYAFVTLPVMFIGSVLGVMLNKLLPSAAIATIIISVATYSLPKIYQRFVEGHRKQTDDNLMRLENQRHSDAIKESAVNPFQNELNVKIFKRIGLLIAGYVAIALLRGSEKFPSLIGVSPCSVVYWSLQLAVLGMAAYFYRWNKQQLEEWTAQSLTLGESLFERENIIEQNKTEIIQKSFMAGVFSGFGLGGGIFLVPMYRQLKLNPLQATATCTFTIFLTATINCLQAILIGVMSFKQFVFFFSVSSIGSYVLSVVISRVLRKANRLSYVEMLLFVLLVVANINLPISLWLKYVQANRDSSVVFGFGTPC